MPNRYIRESIRTSDSLNELNSFEEVFFYHLIVTVDDYGRYDARPKVLRSALFPLREKITEETISKTLDSLSRAGIVTLYEVSGKPYLQFTNWSSYQTIRNKHSKFPGPDDERKRLQALANNCKQMQTDVPGNDNGNDTPPNPLAGEPPPAEREKRKRFVPPTVEEVSAYCAERGNGIDAMAFVAHYASKGWKVGNASMKDWKQAVITWECKRKDENPQNGGDGKWEKV